MMKKAFISWSGGKDCTFALHHFLKENSKDSVKYLLNMDRATTQNAHRLTSDLLQMQADALGVDLMSEKVEAGNSYVYHFNRAVNRLKEEGVEYGVFGDIHLQAHKDWIESTCQRLGITPLFPLWGMDIHDIFNEFVGDGFESKIISVKNEDRFRPMLGQYLTDDLYHQMLKHSDFDICGENGEYHTFVVNGPIFNSKVDYRVVAKYEDDKIYALELDTAVVLDKKVISNE